MIRRALIGLIALVLLGGAVACGGDDSGGSDETDESAAADAEGADKEGTDAGDQGDGDNGDGGLLGAGGSDDFCGQISAFGESLQTDITAPNSFMAMFGQIMDIEPPEEIASEWDLLFGTAEEGGDAVASMSEEERQQFQEAAQTVGTYIAENCSS